MIMPTFRGSKGRPDLSLGTVGMEKDFEVTVCAFRRFGLACRCKSEGRDGASREREVEEGTVSIGRGTDVEDDVTTTSVDRAANADPRGECADMAIGDPALGPGWLWYAPSKLLTIGGDRTGDREEPSSCSWSTPT